MINDSSLIPSKDVFWKVALEIFSDGKFNWGRVVALFYFACRLVIKVSEEPLLCVTCWNMKLFHNTLYSHLSRLLLSKFLISSEL